MVEQFDTSVSTSSSSSDSGECEEYSQGRVFVANDSCIKMINSTSYQSAIASVGSDGSQSLKLFTDKKCSTTRAAQSFSIKSSVVAAHSCYDGEYKFFSESEYTSGSGSYSSSEDETLDGADGSAAASKASSSSVSSEDTPTGSGLGTAASALIVAVALVVPAMICAFFFYCKRRSKRAKDSLANLSTPDDIGGFVNAVLVQEIPRTTVSTAQSSRSGDGDKDAGGLWRDEVILGARVPREKVVVKRLISRSGYGEVYIGIYNRQRVAVKMLLPETRKCKEHRDSFLAEVKLMAALDHPQIVRLIGVAWDSPNDLCSLTLVEI